MRRIAAIACLLFSGYIHADVFHPENPAVRGHIGSFADDVCFNSDGSTNSSSCPTSGSGNEGYVFIFNSSWRGDPAVTINGCGIDAVKPVSAATCPLTGESFAVCTPNQYVLVKTLISGRYFALRAGNTCGIFNRPEEEVIFPCLSTDAFSPVQGCYAVSPNAPQVSIDGGFIKLDVWGALPPATLCNEPAHYGRMVVDSDNMSLYVCTQAGWATAPLAGAIQ